MKEYNFSYIKINASGFFGKQLKDLFLFFINFFRTIFIFPFTLLKLRPKAIIASGGFVSFVPLIWALLLNKKYFLLEQNRIPGRITKYFARWANEIYLGFPLIKIIRGNTIYTGTPIRSQFYLSKQNVQQNSKIILALGGSQGADFITTNVIELANQMQNLQFIIQTGRRNFQKIKNSIKSDNCHIIDFTFHPEELYQKAMCVISRAGGVALSEILFFGLPSIIIPFPFATDNHQAANAQFLAQNNAAIIISQHSQHGLSFETVNKLKNIIQSLQEDENKYTRLSTNAQRIAKNFAVEIITKRITACLAE